MNERENWRDDEHDRSEIVAYYTCWCWPSIYDVDPRPYMSVSAELSDHRYIEIYRRTAKSKRDNSISAFKNKQEAARAILRHWLQTHDIEDKLIEALVEWPAHSLHRIAVEDLRTHIDEMRQLSLFE